jgi:hypothetical protein
MKKLGLPRFAPGATLALGFMLSACGGSSAGNGPDAGGDSHMGSDAGRDTGTKPEAGHKDTGAVDAAPPDKTPITGLPTEKWTWVPFPDAKCRDGSSTGIGVSLNPASDKVMLFLEGGNACFNAETCLGGNPSSFSEADFHDLVTTSWNSAAGAYSANVGIMDRTNAANPVKDWSYVYVPYCTGDLHAGNNVVVVEGVSKKPQEFVGYVNVGLYLDRLVPTFSKATQVLLAGMSAGGFGAALNYGQVAKAFGSIPVSMLDDSGPFLENPAAATCLQNEFRSLWGFDKTVEVACGGDCTNASSFFLDYVEHVIKAYPKAAFGLVDSIDDARISLLAGFGANDCKSFTPVSASVYGAGLLDIRSKLASESNYGEFLFPGTKHTSIQDPSFFTQTSTEGGDAGTDAGPGVLLTDWVAQLVAGTAANVGP